MKEANRTVIQRITEENIELPGTAVVFTFTVQTDVKRHTAATLHMTLKYCDSQKHCTWHKVLHIQTNKSTVRVRLRQGSPS